MGTRKNKQLDTPDSGSPGKVVIDSRGRNVWQWSGDQLDSTTIMLQRLDNSSLSLEPTRQYRRPRAETEPEGRRVKRARGARPQGAADPRSRSADTGTVRVRQSFDFKLGGGFDPYNRG